MTDKARLEEIINYRNLPNNLANPDVFIPDIKQPIEVMRTHDIDWLIHQAQLRQEQVDKNLQALENIDVIQQSYEQLKEENQRYKEGLEFYADENNHGDSIEDFEYEPPIYHDNGGKARRALRGEST